METRIAGQAIGVCCVSWVVLGLIRRVKRRIYLTRVAVGACAKASARVLPNLPPAIPMEAKLRQLCGHEVWLFLVKFNPNPLADNLTQFPKTRGFVIKHVQNSVCGKPAIVKSPSKINPMQFAFNALCGPVLEL
jgi:hypothetical protein